MRPLALHSLNFFAKSERVHNCSAVYIKSSFRSLHDGVLCNFSLYREAPERSSTNMERRSDLKLSFLLFYGSRSYFKAKSLVEILPAVSSIP